MNATAPRNVRPGQARSVSDAGLSAGFENPSHFARMFRKIVGVSPSRFRFKMH